MAAAHRLLAASGAASGAPDGALGGAADDGRGTVAAAERAVARLADTLGRLFGPYGTYALFTRALTRTRPQFPALGSVQVRAPLAPALEGLAEAARTHGESAAVDGVAAFLTAAVELLGRMIGEDLAVQLVERSLESSMPHVPNALPSVRGPSDDGNGGAS